MSARAIAQLIYAIGAMIVALVLLLWRPDQIGATLALVEISTAIVFASALFPPGLDRSDFGDLLFLVSLPFLLGFGVRAVLSLAAFVPRDVVGDIVQDPSGFAHDEISLSALTLATISWGMLFCGYRLKLGEAISARLPNPSLADLQTGSIRIATLVLAAVGWSARIASMAQGSVVNGFSTVESVSAVATLILWLSFLTTASTTLALFTVFFRRADPASVLIAVGLVAGEMIAGFITGSRTLVFTSLVGAAGMAYLTGRHHLKLRHLVVIPALLLVIGVTDTYRNPSLIIASNVDANNIVGKVQLAIDESVVQGPLQLTYRGALNVAFRYHGLWSVAQILRVGPPPDLSYGTPYVVAVPAALIPRFLWPGKPLQDYGVNFGRKYLGVPESVGVSYAPTWVGDLMLNIPLLLVPCVMGLLGVFLRVLRGYGMRARDGASFAVLVYATLLPIFIQSDSWISGEVWQATQAMAVLFVTLALMRSLSPATGSHPSSGLTTWSQSGRSGVTR